MHDIVVSAPILKLALRHACILLQLTAVCMQSTLRAPCAHVAVGLLECVRQDVAEVSCALLRRAILYTGRQALAFNCGGRRRAGMVH